MFCPDIAPELQQIVARSMHKDAAWRYQSLDDRHAEISQVRARLNRADATIIVPEFTDNLETAQPRSLPPRTLMSPGIGIVPAQRTVG